MRRPARVLPDRILAAAALEFAARGYATDLQAYLDEFTFRFNGRRTPMAAFQTLLGLGSQQQPTTYKQLYGVESNG